MSISVQCSNIHVPWSNFSGYFGTIRENAENTYQVSTVFASDNNNRIYQLSTASTMPCCRNYVKIANETKYVSTDSTNQALAESGNSSSFTKTDCLVHEHSNYDKPGNVSEYYQKEDSQEKCAVPGTENKLKIWRPFSPPPSIQMDNTGEKGIHYQNNRSTNKNSTFFTIKPSNVKIGQSKMSVFKAVKKNTFACTYCPSRYQSNRQLNTHMRMHIGSKPFRCEFSNCFKSFARNEELTRHKRIHSGFKPHFCSVCKKRFGRKDHLSKHLKTHLQTSEKKVYQCTYPDCGHRYTRSDALTRHKTTAHAKKDQK